jgi:hypothetical protein
MTITRESVFMTCPCGYRFRMLADEYADHQCPRCGRNPSDDTLESDVAGYVERCRERGVSPDAFAFSTMYQRTYGRTPGSTIARLIDKELERYAVN